MLRPNRILGWLGIGVLLVACSDRRTAPDGALRTIDGPGGQPIGVPMPLTGLMPANGAVLDFVAEFVGPEGVVALPRGTLEYANLAGDALQAWSKRPIVADLQLEELISARVDFVIAHDWQEAQLHAILGRARVGVLYLPTVRSFADLEASLGWVGAALDRPERARDAIEKLRALRSDLERRGAQLHDRTAMVYSNYGAGGGTSGAGTSYDLMIQLAGLTNAAAQAGIVGHVDLAIEGLLSIQPDFLILTKDENGTSASLESLRLALGEAPLAAVTKDWVVLLPSNQLTTASHHLVYAAQSLQQQVQQKLSQ